MFFLTLFTYVLVDHRMRQKGKIAKILIMMNWDLERLVVDHLWIIIVLPSVLLILWMLFGEIRVPKQHLVDYNVHKKRFLVTGAASGIGKHLTDVLLRNGHLVMATDKDFKGLKQAGMSNNWMGTDRCFMKPLDVTVPSDWESAVRYAEQAMGGVDVLLNVAGFLRPGRVQKVEDDDVDAHIDVNVKGVIHGTRYVSKWMIRNRLENRLPDGGHIINFASLGAIAPVSGYTMYIASKYAVRGFSICAAKDLLPEGIYVSVILPDAVATPMADLQLEYEEAAMAYSGKLLTVQDIEKVVIDHVLPNKPREVLVPSDRIRGSMARLADIFHSSRILAFAESMMRKKGLQVQEELKQHNKASKKKRVD